MSTARVKYIGNIRSAPIWAGDFGGREHIMAFPAKIDASQFTDGAAVVVTLAASAIATATSLTVVALTLPLLPDTTLITQSQGLVLIPSGTVLNFGGSAGKFAVLTADAKLGDTTLTVSPIPTALTGTEVANYSRYGSEFISSGTVIGRTFAMRDAGTPFRPALVTDDEIFLTVFDIPDAHLSDDVELYRPQSQVKENYLPQYTVLSTAVNEVQTLNFANSPAGTFRLRITDVNGVEQETDPITYSGTAATLVSNMQTAINAVIPQVTSVNQVVVSGSAVTAIALTFSGTGAAYAGKQFPIVKFDGDGLTAGRVSLTETTQGGTPLLTKLRSLYRCYKGQD